MPPLSDETLFERFRARGDADALGELFDRVAPTLLRIALHLARDPAGAEDLLQGTFLLAIESRREWDGQRPLLPWLCGILHNRARAARRQVGRAPDPMRIPARAVDDPQRAAESAEFDDAVDAAIATLPEIYQPVLRLHLAYAHEPVEIAHALGRPPGTVRSQLARGLEMLRQALPVSLIGGLASCGVVERGLVAVKEVVIAGAASAVPAVGSLGTLVGGTIAMKKTTLAVAVAGIAAATWFVWPQSASMTLPSPSPSPAQLSAASSSVAAPVTSSPTAGVQREAVQDAGSITTGALKITCLFADDRSPARGLVVTVTPEDVPDGSLLRRDVTTDTDGIVNVPELPVGEVLVAADRGGDLRLAVVAGRTTDAELVIPTGIDVHGRVVDERKEPVRGAQVWLSQRARSYCDGQQVARADAAGRFFLRAVEPERFLSATAPCLRGAVAQPVRGRISAALEVELVLRGAGASLLGKVVDASGRPVAGARVLVGFREDEMVWSPDQFPEYRPPAELRTDERGGFRADGLAPGSRTWIWTRAPGTCATRTEVTLEVAGDTAITLQLALGGTIVGRATDGVGQPLAPVFIDARSTAWHRGDFDIDFHGPRWALSLAFTGDDGSYRLTGVTPGQILLRARSTPHEVRGELALEDGATATWNPVLGEVALRGRVVDERDRPLVGFDVTGQAPRGRGSMASGKTDAEGRFICPATPGVPYVVTLYAKEDSIRARPVATLRGVLPGGPEQIVRVLDAMLPSAVIAGTLLDTDGRPPAKGRLRWCTADSEGEADVDSRTGRFRIQPLAAGTYRLQGSVDWWRRSSWSEPFPLAPHELRQAGVIQMPATGSIAVTVIGPDGKPVEGTDLSLEDSSGWAEWMLSAGKTQQGHARILDVAPGIRRVRASGRDLPDVYQTVTVAANAEAKVQIEVPAAVPVRLAISAVTEPAPIHVTFVWMRDDHAHERYVNWIEGAGEMIWPRRLVPGRYEVTATSETGKRAVSRFVIAGDDPPGRAIPITLP